jgi:hypothetical protein
MAVNIEGGMEMDKGRVHSLDDHEDSFEDLRQTLADDGYEVLPRVASKFDVVKRLHESYEHSQYLQFIMIDLDLGPNQDGGDVYAALVRECPKERFIVYTRDRTDRFRQMQGQVRLRDDALVLLTEAVTRESLGMLLSTALPTEKPNRVFLVHGRDTEKTLWLMKYFKVLGLDVRRLDDVRAEAESRYLFDVVRRGVASSQATVVLFADEMTTRMNERYRTPGNEEDAGVYGCSRPNVYIEAGYAQGLKPHRTIFVEWPEDGNKFMRASDFAGIQAVRFGDERSFRHRLRIELEQARCVLHPASDWETQTLPSTGS